jgi:hypothetical protein
VVRAPFVAAVIASLATLVAIQGEFVVSLTAKIALAVILAVLWLRVLDRFHQRKFERFWVKIEPDRSAISRDYAVDPEDLRAIYDKAQPERCARVRGIRFTVLEPGLAFCPEYQKFLSELNTHDNLPGTEARWKQGTDDARSGDDDLRAAPHAEQAHAQSAHERRFGIGCPRVTRDSAEDLLPWP